MAAIRHTLQQDLFRPNDEALYSVVSVAKVGVGKKKKANFLCAAGKFLSLPPEIGLMLSKK